MSNGFNHGSRARFRALMRLGTMLPRWMHRLRLYGLALLLAATGGLVRWGLVSLVGPGLSTFITFYPFVMLAALVGGWGPGFLATLTAALWVNYWQMPPYGFGLERPADAVNLVIFCSIGMFMSVVAGLFQRTRGHLKGLVQERTRQLETADGQLQAQAGELRTATEELRQSEYLRRLAEEITRVGAFEWNTVTGVNTWTPEFEALYGLPPGGFAGTYTAWEQLVHPEDRARAVAAIQRAFETSATVEDEWRVIWPDGSIHWLAGRFRILRDEAGQPRTLTGVNIDITERKRAEAELLKHREHLEELVQERTSQLAAANARLRAQGEELQRYIEQLRLQTEQLTDTNEALQESEQQVRRIMEATPMGVALGDTRGRILDANDAYLRIIGCTREDLHAGRIHWDRITPEEYLPRDVQAIAEAQETGVSATYEKEYLRPDGRRVPVLLALADISGKGQLTAFVMDIAERKQAEEALRQGEARLQLALKAGRMAAWEYDPATKEVSLSENVDEVLLALPTGQKLSNSDQGYSLIHPDDVETHRALVTQAIQNARGYISVYRQVRDGRVFWLEERAQAVTDESGRTVRLIGVTQDITERKQAEEAVRQSERQFRTTFENAAIGIAHVALDGHILQFNSRFCEIAGYLPDDIIGKTCEQITFADDWEAERAQMQRLRDGQTDHYAIEKRYIRADGSPVWVNLTRSIQRDEAGRPEYFIVLVEDISDRKRAQEALGERMKELACLYATSRDMQEELSVEELCRRVVAHLVPALQFPESAVAVIELNGKRFASENYREGLSHGLQAQIGGEGEVLGHLRVYYAPERAFLIPEEQNMVDVVAKALSMWLVRKHVEEALRELNAALENKVAERTAELKHRARQLQKLTLDISETEDRERKRMAEILHDDLQQQIAGAKFHLGLMRNRVRYDASLQAIGAQVDHMLKDAIDKSRSLSHELSPTVLHHADFVQTLRWLADDVQAKHGLSVHVRALGAVPLPSDALKSFLYRAAQELLFNIVKHAGVNDAEIRARQCCGHICLAVSDRGRGFDPQELRETTGFGLLSIRERIGLLGGRMKIKSAKGTGSTFLIIVPNGEPVEPGTQTTARPNGRAKAAEQAAAGGNGRLRVLLADDHEIVREGLRSLLSDTHDVEVVGEAANGREAVDLASRLQPDVIIMDVSMPLIEGDEATRQIKAYLPRTRVIALSMYDQSEKVEAMYRAGAENYVLKTAPTEELLAAIRGEESDVYKKPQESAV